MARPIQYCTVSGCSTQREGHGFCSKHYQRWIKYGDENTILIAPKGAGTIGAGGYRRLFIKGRNVAHHRYVMEQIIGRRLGRDEFVHHINHDRLDNVPQNLQIVSRKQHVLLHSTFRNETHKQCSKCFTIKPRWAFPKDNAHPNSDRNFPWCKDCCNTTNRLKKLTNPPNTNCSNCGIGCYRYPSMIKRITFCSNTCRSKYLRNNHWSKKVTSNP